MTRIAVRGIILRMTLRHSTAALTIASASLLAGGVMASAPRSVDRPPLTQERLQAMSECDAMTNRTEANYRSLSKEDFLAFMARKAETCALAHPSGPSAPDPTNWVAIAAAVATIPALALGVVVLRGRGKRGQRLRGQR